MTGASLSAAFVYSKKNSQEEYNELASHYNELRKVNLAQYKEIQELKVNRGKKDTGIRHYGLLFICLEISMHLTQEK